MANRVHRIRRIGIVALAVLTMTVVIGCGESTPTAKFEVTPKTIQEATKYLEIDVNSPEIKGVPGGDRLNETITSRLDAALADVRDAAKAIEETRTEPPNLMAGLHGDYSLFHNQDLASLWILMDNYTGGAHGMYWIDSYTFNPKTGEIYTLPDLFIDDPAGLTHITDTILAGKDDPDRGYMPGAEETIASYNNAYPFLINGDELIVYFPLYEFTPYAAGMQHFVFPLSEISTYLKPEIVSAMTDQEPVNIPFFH